jgi:aspartate racemase
MKTVGMLGGMSWQSTLAYYRLMNEDVAARLGGYHSARLLLCSVDFHGIESAMSRGAWDEAAAVLVEAARSVERAGADALILTSNTLHRVAGRIASAVSIPFLHIVDATVAQIRGSGAGAVGLLGTRFVMEEAFYRERFEAAGVKVLVPAAADREVVHRVIFEELVLGEVVPASRAEYRRVIRGLAAAGAQGVVLGCTEIAMLVDASDSPVPLFDTTAIHARAAVDFALSSEASAGPPLLGDRNPIS